MALEPADSQPRFRSARETWDPEAILTGPPMWRSHQHNPPETYWIGLRNTLDERGYLLRPRFREGWVPSWLGTHTHYTDTEDGQVHTVRTFSRTYIQQI